jgi:hypothetical protein
MVRHLDVARRAGTVAHQGKAVAIGVLNHAGRYSDALVIDAGRQLADGIVRRIHGDGDR